MTDKNDADSSRRRDQRDLVPPAEAHRPPHTSVLLPECLELLNIRAGLTYVDATLGAGGHFKAILNALEAVTPKSGADGSTKFSVIGIDRDLETLNKVREQIAPERASLVHANYTDLDVVVEQCGINTITGGIIADLGVSSMQLDNSERGFSFQKDGPLDMRMDQTQDLRAWDIVNKWGEKEIADIIYEYGEERYSRLIARNIVASRPIQSTLQLADIVSRSVRYGARGKQHKQRHSANFKERVFNESHPATRTFQALRIAVNDELGGLKKFIERCIDLLAPGARLVIITFHSLEDRLVKQIFRHYASSCHCPPRQPQCTCGGKSELLIITKKPIIANEQELLANIRSRSAKLRAGEKIG